MILPLPWAASNYYDYLTKYMGVLLLAIALMMIKSEMGPQIEGQGSLVHYKYKALASMLFLTSGLLGIFAFQREGLIASPLGLQAQVLLPLLSGIFGASSLLYSLSTGTEIPEQKESRIKLKPGLLAIALFSGSLGGSVVAWIPGVSPSIAAITARLGRPSSPEEFLVSNAGVNTANALFSLVALYVIDRPRSGAAAAIKELMALDQSALVEMVIIMVLVAAASYLACLAAACPAGKAVSQINYRLLCLGVLAFLAVMCYAFTGLFGLFIFFLSTVVGLIAPIAGIHRTHAMGVLMLPLIVRYI
jgi:putative membrane protein